MVDDTGSDLWTFGDRGSKGNYVPMIATLCRVEV